MRCRGSAHSGHREEPLVVIGEQFLNLVSAQAKVSPRLRMRSACRFACQRTITSQDLLKTRDARISGRAERGMSEQSSKPSVLRG